ncbi:glycosyltransferase family 2 protein [Phocaeicola sp.]
MLEKLNPPKISVLIPVYNVEKYVERCILSVLNQTMQEGVEVIIVNDCTPDHSMEIIREVLRNHLKKDGMTVRIVEHKINRGLAASRNTAMSYAKGDYTIHVDSDDYVELDMLEKMYTRAVETDADIVTADHWNEYHDYSVYTKAPFNDNGDIIFPQLIRGKSTYLWDKLIKRSLYLVNHIVWQEGMDWKEDFRTTIPLCFFARKIIRIPKAFYHYVQYNEGSITMKKNHGEKDILNWLSAASFLTNFIKENDIRGYEQDVAYYLLRTKVFCITFSGSNFLPYLYLYPQTNRYKKWYIKEESIAWRNKLYFYCILSNNFVIASIYLGMKILSNKILSMIKR